MTYQEKMAQAIEKAERWQAEVDAIEVGAEAWAKQDIRDKRDRKDKDKPVELGPVLLAHLKQRLKDDTLYQRAVSNRNAQQTLAQMYGTAALVAAQYGMVTQ